MKYFIISFFLIITSFFGKSYADNSDWRSMPFIEMMAKMMSVMNNIMTGSDNYNPYYPYYAYNALQYSPTMTPGLGGMGSLPMSSTGFNSLPLTPNTMGNVYQPFQNTFQTGQNAHLMNNLNTNFWNPSQKALNSNVFTNNTTLVNQGLNGIWQATSGDVIAIYQNNRFMWSDGNTRNLCGQLVIRGNQFFAYIPASNSTLQFQFYKEPGQFIVKDKNQRVYAFKKIH